jgi:hypothetical protein
MRLNFTWKVLLSKPCVFQINSIRIDVCTINFLYTKCRFVISTFKNNFFRYHSLIGYCCYTSRIAHRSEQLNGGSELSWEFTQLMLYGNSLPVILLILAATFGRAQLTSNRVIIKDKCTIRDLKILLNIYSLMKQIIAV